MSGPWYSIHNGGDGSAYSVIFADRKWAEFDQECHNDGEYDSWAEDCCGPVGKPKTEEEYLFELKEVAESSWATSRDKDIYKRALEIANASEQ